MDQIKDSDRRIQMQAQIKSNPFKPLYAAIHDVLRQEIITCRLTPDSLLKEVDLSHSFGVSRTTVRSALDALLSDGFVEPSGRSMQVTWMTRPLHDQLHEFRRRIDPVAAELAASRRSRNDIEKLRKTLDLCEKAKEPVAFIEADSLFHHTIYELAHNRFLLQAYDQIEPSRKRINYYAMTSLVSDDLWAFNQTKIQRMKKEHAGLFEAILNGEEGEASRIAEKHVGLLLLDFDAYEHDFRR